MILTEDGGVVKAESRYLGKRTNNQAEYEALIAALKAAVELGAKEAVCHLDSELVCRHLTGAYRVKNPELRKLWGKVQELKACFARLEFVNVPRTDPFIRQADFLVNQRLDQESKRPM